MKFLQRSGIEKARNLNEIPFCNCRTKCEFARVNLDIEFRRQWGYGFSVFLQNFKDRFGAKSSGNITILMINSRKFFILVEKKIN